ncbi:hypothetical protein KGF57_000757 [Candida theae]|uniref:Uncharacterized protein n=1 Tax=Candida theae TaxID=1198502 RepID=A0AAD5G0F4_9ASCO|nr:uncharacterized protein KGF57_000757 [Candida theae]KAI5965491.1 hypothetical protein KGF57_000757 [Candida theae]
MQLKYLLVTLTTLVGAAVSTEIYTISNTTDVKSLFYPIEEEHMVHEFEQSEEIHSWKFYNYQHFQSSQLWQELDASSGVETEFNQTVVHLIESNETLILSSLSPVTFFEFEIDSFLSHGKLGANANSSVDWFGEDDDGGGIDDELDLDQEAAAISGKERGFGGGALSGDDDEDERATMIIQFDPDGEILKRASPNTAINLFLVSLFVESGADGVKSMVENDDTIFIVPSKDGDVQFEAQGILKLIILPILKLKKLIWIIEKKTIALLIKLKELTAAILKKTKRVIILFTIKTKLVILKTLFLIKQKVKKAKLLVEIVAIVTKEKTKYKIKKTLMIIAMLKEKAKDKVRNTKEALRAAKDKLKKGSGDWSDSD